ncbi:MAG: hypothetical protein ACHQEB_05915 [Chitinophagales bacterium]
MKKYIFTAVFITSVILISCVRSLYPLTDNEDESIFKKELLGRWLGPDSTQYIVDTVPGKSGKLYKIVLIDVTNNVEIIGFSDTSYFVASLVDVNGRFFLDCSTEMEKFENKTLGESAINLLVPTHFIIRLDSMNDRSIGIASLDEDAFSELLKTKKFSIRHQEINEDDFLLTESPGQLQRKLKDLERFPSVFHRAILTRMKE